MRKGGRGRARQHRIDHRQQPNTVRGEAFSDPASSAGVLGLKQSMAIATAGFDRVNAISHGSSNPAGKWLVEGLGSGEQARKGDHDRGLGERNDLAANALFLAPEARDTFTGIELTVDGGRAKEVGLDRSTPPPPHGRTVS